MDLRTFVNILLRSWWLIVLSVVTTAGSAFLVVSQQTPIYRASTQVQVAPNSSLEPAQRISVLARLENRSALNTLARLVDSPEFQNRIAKTVNVKPEAVASADVSAVVVPETFLIDVRAISTKPELAAAITDAVAADLSKETLGNVVTVSVLNPAALPTVPIEPQPTRTITLAVVFGFGMGVVFALLGYLFQATRAANNAADEDAVLGGDETEQLDVAAQANQTRRLFTQ